MTTEAVTMLGKLTDDNYDSEGRTKLFEAIRVAQDLGFTIEAEYVAKTFAAIPETDTTRAKPAREEQWITFFAVRETGK